jgi:hypothetical protein
MPPSEICTQVEPNALALRTPAQLAGGAGIAHRRLPTGGVGNAPERPRLTIDHALQLALRHGHEDGRVRVGRAIGDRPGLAGVERVARRARVGHRPRVGAIAFAVAGGARRAEQREGRQPDTDKTCDLDLRRPHDGLRKRVQGVRCKACTGEEGMQRARGRRVDRSFRRSFRVASQGNFARATP